MSTILASKLIDLFERMAREHWAYEWGAARKGCVDCSGAFVYAYKALGGENPPTIEHGSNSILRMRTGADCRAIAHAKPGWACFKVRPWQDEDRGNRWYGLTPGDAYHIGLMGRDGLIYNAQSTATGFVASKPSDGWNICAPLTAVDYDETGGEIMGGFGNASVYITSGYLNLRAGASTTAKVLAKLDKYERVNVIRDTGTGWLYVKTEMDEAGYVAEAYISMDAETGEDEDAQDEGAQTETAYTTIVREDGAAVMLVGRWRVAED